MDNQILQKLIQHSFNSQLKLRGIEKKKKNLKYQLNYKKK